MKKSLIAVGVIVILGAAYTGASWYTGNQIENGIDEKIEQIVEKLNHQQNDYAFNVMYSDYQKGIFSTSLRLKIEAKSNSIFSVLDDSNDDVVFNDIVKIYHGPFPWSEVRSGSFLPKMAAFFYQSSQEFDEELWKAAGNKPFITINSTIDYSENINFHAKNAPVLINDEDQGATYELEENGFSLSADKYFNQFHVALNLTKFHFISPSQEIKINNFIYHGDANYQLEEQFYQIDSQIKFNQLLWNTPLQRVEFKDLLLNSNDKIKQNNIIDGQVKASINSVILNKQNLGSGELDIAYNFPSREFFANQTYLNQIVDDETFTIDLNSFVWHTNQGNLNAEMAFKVDGNLFETSKLYEDNLSFAKANIQLPLNAIALLTAQVNNSNSGSIDEQDILEAKQSIIMLSQLFLMNSPLLSFNYNSPDESQNGFNIDFYYDRSENKARIRDKELSTHEFWRIVNIR